MVCRARTNSSVVRIRRTFLASSVSDTRFQNALILRGREVLEEDVLGSPETSRGKGRDLGLPGCCNNR